MKKLYTLALAAAVALSAAAADVLTLSPIDAPMRQSFERLTVKKATKVFESQRVAKAPARVATQADLFGEYTWEYLDPRQNGGERTGTLVLSAVDEPGAENYVTIEGIASLPAYGLVDYEKATLTLGLMNLGPVQATTSDGQEMTVDVYLFPTGLDEAGNDNITDEPVVATFDGTGIFIPEDRGISLVAVNPEAGQQLTENDLIGFFDFCIFNVIKKFDSAAWTELGPGHFVNGIFSSFYLNPTSATIEADVTILRSNTNANVLLIKNAFTNIGGWNMEVDVTDVNNVKVYPQFTGFMDAADGATYLCSQSVVLTELIQNPVTDADFLAQAGEYAITIKDNVITFPGNSVLLQWPNSISQGTDPQGWYSAQNPRVSTVTLPKGWDGIEDITVEEDGAVEYFNLQGIRVANPEAGLYIRRAGSKVEKIFVK